jgi:Quinohemoprotein amine dehydrogenase A, alpha subunit, haem binding
MNTIRKRMAVFLLAGGLVLGSALTAFAEDESALPQGPHRVVVEETCTACHSAAIILQNRMSRKRWDETITWMQNEQGLMDLSAQVRKQILDYLEDVRGTTSPFGKPSPETHRMYEFDYPPNPL